MTYAQDNQGEDASNEESGGRRQQTRRSYKASACICRAGTASQHEATVLDLSSTGTLLRLFRKGDFEVDDMVDISLQSSDLTFRARGSIRQIRDEGSLLGIKLESLSSRGRSMLDDLIRELESGVVLSSQG